MKINGKIHILFEQSGTFKREFQKLGYQAFDYDISDAFGETDYKVDLFEEILAAIDFRHSIFDNFIRDDLILAFFPCTFFSCQGQLDLYFNNPKYHYLSYGDRWSKIMNRIHKRHEFYLTLLKLVQVCQNRQLRLIIENPFNSFSYLKNNFPFRPSFVDYDRTSSGDKFHKPTAYWFFGCTPCNLKTYQRKHTSLLVESVYGFERSMISSEYAHNFICDKILGISSGCWQQLDLFS